MTDRMHISASERGQVRLFAVDLSPDDARAFFETPDDGVDWPLLDALGAQGLDPEWVDMVVPAELGEMSLSEFLVEGPGVSAQALDGDRERLDALTTPLLVLPSQAFGGEEQELAPEPPLRWIGTYPELRPSLPGAPLRSESARGHLQRSESAERPRQGSRMAAYVVAALIALGALVAGLAVIGGRS